MTEAFIYPDTAHTELYGLFSQAEIIMTSAIDSTAFITTQLGSFSSAEGAEDIFDASLTALTEYKWNGHLPILDEDYTPSTSHAVYPPVIYVALAYCLKAQSLTLQKLKLSSGYPSLDSVILSWPSTLLRDLSAKSRFFDDLRQSYTTTIYYPLLSDPNLRALQLLVIAKHLLIKQKEKIGKPYHPRILRL